MRAPILSVEKYVTQKLALTDIRINAHDVGRHHKINVKALVAAGNVQTHLVERMAALVASTVAAVASMTSHRLYACGSVLVVSSGCAGRRYAFAFERLAAWRLIVEPLYAGVVIFEFHFGVLLHDDWLDWLVVYVIRELACAVVIEVKELALVVRLLALH